MLLDYIFLQVEKARGATALNIQTGTLDYALMMVVVVDVVVVVGAGMEKVRRGVMMMRHFRLLLFLAASYMSEHLLLDKVRSAYDRQCPVLVLADGDEDVLFLEEVAFACPASDALVPVTHRVSLLACRGLLLLRRRLLLLLLLGCCCCWLLLGACCHHWLLGRLLELGEELGVEDVDFGLERPRDHVVLQEAQMEKDQDVVEIDSRLEKLEVFLADGDVAIVLSVDQFADHVVFFDFG